MKIPGQKIASKSSSYLIPYSYEESDQLSGYASGMPYPAFYQHVHTNIINGNTENAYTDAVMHFLVKCGNKLRSKGVNVSLSEETAAFVQSKGLAQLRGKTQPGVYELLDGIKSTYIKSELNVLSSNIMQVCQTILRGEELGKVSDKADIVPLLKDFRWNIEHFKLKAGSARADLELDILTNTKHREISVFFRRLNFLDIPYAVMKAGPDYKSQNTSRVRERWCYARNAKVEATVIDASYLGGTVEEAAINLINKRRYADIKSCEYFSSLLIDVVVMDLHSYIEPLLNQVSISALEDSSFESLVKAASNLMYIEQIKWLFDNQMKSFHLEILTQIYFKAVSLLAYLSTKDEDEDRQFAKHIKTLHQVASLDGMDEDVFYEALQDLAQNDSVPPYLQGSALGLLYSKEKISVDEVLCAVNSYLFGTKEMMKLSGRFIGGIFFTSWDIIFHHSLFLDGINNVLSKLEEADFLTLLPDLRLAFSSLSPTNINRVAEMVSKIVDNDAVVLVNEAVPEQVLLAGISLDSYVTEILISKGLYGK